MTSENNKVLASDIEAEQRSFINVPSQDFWLVQSLPAHRIFPPIERRSAKSASTADEDFLSVEAQEVPEVETWAAFEKIETRQKHQARKEDTTLVRGETCRKSDCS
jgi:hypothetical protein